jgi:hypothetical protein
MPMMSPNPAELRIIRSLIIKNLGPASPFLNQIASLRFPLRNLTGTGYFLEFDALPRLLRADAEDVALSTDLVTRRPPPCDLVGFTLFINGGFMTSFEGYTFGDVAWPDELMEDWLIHDAA